MRRIALLLAGLVAASAFASPLVAAPKGTNHNNSDDTAAEGCGDGNELVIHAPATLWPPNHKYYEDIYALATDEDGGDITLNTYGWHNQYDGDTELNGSGNTADDITTDDAGATKVQWGFEDGDQDTGKPTVFATEDGSGEVQTDWMARAERSGRDKDGRVYNLRATADFADGGSCELTVPFTVPHDMRKANRQ